jgi:Predicted integral membrane protein
MTPAQDQSYLCDGIAEEILRALNRIPDLYVASRTSAFQFKGRSGDIRDIGAKLNVETILEGSVRRAGNRVRIAAQLVNVSDGYRLWNDRYDREMKDIFSIEEEIADQIAAALQVTLVDRGRHATRTATAADAEAYELYLQGRQFFHQHRRKGFEIAIQTFQRVIEIDPLSARAFAGIADCNSFLRVFLGGGEEAVAAADEASRRALELDPELPEAHAARGFALLLQRDFEGSERELSRAIELAPRLYDPHYTYGRVCFSQGRNAEAAAHFREACEIVPEAYDSWYLLGMAYRRLEQPEKALNAHLECIEAAKKRLRNHPEDTRAWTMGAAVLAELGEPERAGEWIERALAIDSDEPIIVYNAACVYTSLKRFDEAIECLRNTTSVSKDWIANDPDLDPLRDDPRFREIVESM